MILCLAFAGYAYSFQIVTPRHLVLVIIVSITKRSIDWFSAHLFAKIGARSRGCPITGIQFQRFVIGKL